MEPLQVTTHPQPNGLHRILWSDGTPLGQREWPRPVPAAIPNTGPSLSLLDALADTARLVGLPTAARRHYGPYRAEQRAERERALAEAPSSAQLREWRIAAGLSQRDAAALCGVTRGMIASLELGKRQAPETRCRVGRVLEREALKRQPEGMPAGQD